MKRRAKIKYFCVALALSVAFWVGVQGHKRDKDQREAIQSCLVDLESNCPGVFGYAVTLEEENSRLNKIIDRLRSQLGECEYERSPER